ncbi:MAG: hypothetical protein ABJZ56_03650 [Paracoccaceae bacterium]
MDQDVEKGFWETLPQIVDSFSNLIETTSTSGLIGAVALLAILLVVVVLALSRGSNSYLKGISIALIFLFFIFLVLSVLIGIGEKPGANLRVYLTELGLIDDDPYPQLSNQEIVLLLQTGLSEARCNPGKLDGVYGVQTQFAATRFNHFVEETCAPVLLPQQKGTGQAWRQSISQAATVLSQCEIQVCPFVPPRHILTSDSFCLVFNARPIPGETASWSGQCDNDGFATGNGQAQWWTADGQVQLWSHDGWYERGRFVEGSRYRRGEFPVVEKGHFLNDQLNGPGERCFPTVGTCRVGKFAKGVYTPTSGYLLFENENRYTGGTRNGLPHGKGTMVYKNHPSLIRSRGTWENGVLVRRSE